MTNPTLRYTAVDAPSPCTACVLQSSAPLEPTDGFTAGVAALFGALSDRPGALLTWQLEDATDEQAAVDGIRPLNVTAAEGATFSPIYAFYADSTLAVAGALRATWHLAPEVFPLHDPAGIEDVREYYAHLLTSLGGIDVPDRGGDPADALVDAALDALAAQANLGYWPHAGLLAWVRAAGAHMDFYGPDGAISDCRIITTHPDLESICRTHLATAGIELI